eukprot:CAMPEP_0197636810 /NCGR_PEP_ID=MMETSP1338-20131121/12211_1 /TAXON_ID=43686 ORGANISM="Pelagodinium beii, Strain RCC1491" /NCGR_SAMPLE_ID=MMETSP1338 /ASSEMBLY_ACC=CAM_ASM_000754 /LENGTH=282 /DNA_ID=CAMNT_0043209117 /DNA_START=41 /DNA_END=889 /DNA_ORIENTATION=-
MISFIPTAFGIFFLASTDDNEKYGDKQGMSGTAAGMICIIYGLCAGAASGSESADLAKVLILARLSIGGFAVIAGVLIIFIGKEVLGYLLMYVFFALLSVPEAGLLYIYVRHVQLERFLAEGGQMQMAGQSLQPPPHFANDARMAAGPFSAAGIDPYTPHFGGGVASPQFFGGGGDFGLGTPQQAAAPMARSGADFGLSAPLQASHPGMGAGGDFGLGAPPQAAPLSMGGGGDFGLAAPRQAGGGDAGFGLQPPLQVSSPMTGAGADFGLPAPSNAAPHFTG